MTAYEVTAVRDVDTRADGLRPECWCGRPAVKYVSGQMFGFPACRRKTHQQSEVAFSAQADAYVRNPHRDHFHIRMVVAGTLTHEGQ